jgi:hypothetical protein
MSSQDIKLIESENPSNIFSYYPFLDMFDYTVDDEDYPDEMCSDAVSPSIQIKRVLNQNWREEVDKIKVKTLNYIIHIFDKNLNNLKNYINDSQLRSCVRRHDVVC